MELTVVVVPCTVKLPVIIALPSTVTLVAVMSLLENVPFTVTLLNVTLSVVPTAWPIAKLTLLSVTEVTTPVPPSNVKVSVPKLTVSVPEPPAIDNVVEILAVVTAVIKPFALTVNTGIAVVLPKVPTLLLTVARVSAVLRFCVPSTPVNVAVASPVKLKFLAFNHLVVVSELPVIVPIRLA